MLDTIVCILQVKLALWTIDGRKLLRDEMEKERRAARELAASAAEQAAIQQELSPSPSTTSEMKALDSE